MVPGILNGYGSKGGRTYTLAMSMSSLLDRVGLLYTNEQPQSRGIKTQNKGRL